MKLHLTEQTIKNVKATDRQITYSDSSPNRVPGFTLVVGASGRKYFSLLYRTGGQQKRAWIGEHGRYGLTLAQAREQAHRIIGKARQQKTLAVEPFSTAPTRKPAGPTVAEAAKRYVTYCEATKRSSTARECARILDRHLLPTLGTRRVAQIEKADIRAIIDDVADAGKLPMATQILKMSRAFFNWTTDKGLTETNPRQA